MFSNKKFRSGDVVLAQIQFTDSPDIKSRPALILFDEFENYIIAGITSNIEMHGVPITKEEGAIKPSVIKLNYIFTISDIMIKKRLFSLTKEKKQQVYNEILDRLHILIEE